MSPHKSTKPDLTHSIARSALILALLCFSLVLSSSPARAANLTVCASGCNYTTISAAIAAAVAGDTITVSDAIHTEFMITISKNLTIQGLGMNATIVQASNNPALNGYWIFSLNSGVTATIRDMTLRYGNSGLGGPAVNSSGNLTLQRLRITENQATSTSASVFGGAVSAFGTMVVYDSIFSNNKVLVSKDGIAVGGALHVGTGATVRIYNSAFFDNQVIAGNKEEMSTAGEGRGGAIAHYGASLELYNSAVYSNTAQGGDFSGGTGGKGMGGGIYQTDQATNPFTMTNCTIANNLAIGGSGTNPGAGEGGGFWGHEDSAIIFSTILSNTVTNGSVMLGPAGLQPGNPPAVGSRGGGVFSAAATSEAGTKFKNTIVAFNRAPADPSGPDIAGNVRSLDYNLIRNQNGYTISGFTANNQPAGTDPLLLPLAYNGGLTKTSAVQNGSPAIDYIQNGLNGCVGGVTTDQRGGIRAGGTHRGGSACDIGAYEFDAFLTFYLPLIRK
jgi:hypothetical protein